MVVFMTASMHEYVTQSNIPVERAVCVELSRYSWNTEEIGVIRPRSNNRWYPRSKGLNLFNRIVKNLSFCIRHISSSVINNFIDDIIFNVAYKKKGIK